MAAKGPVNNLGLRIKYLEYNKKLAPAVMAGASDGIRGPIGQAAAFLRLASSRESTSAT